MHGALTRLMEFNRLEGAGHWVQQEQVSARLIAFLNYAKEVKTGP